MKKFHYIYRSNFMIMFYAKKRRQNTALVLLGGILAKEYNKSRPFRKHFKKIGMDRTIESIMYRSMAKRVNLFVRAYRWVRLKTQTFFLK